MSLDNTSIIRPNFIPSTEEFCLESFTCRAHPKMWGKKVKSFSQLSTTS